MDANKNLYTRFFEFVHEVKPKRVRLLIEKKDGKVVKSSFEDKYADECVEWLNTHPHGKVDFAWLDPSTVRG